MQRLLLVVFIMGTQLAQSQIIGGKSSFAFLNLPTSAKVAALGGMTLSIPDNDINLAFQNPALIDSTLHKQLSLNYVNYLGDINFGTVAYAHRFKNKGTFMAGLHYLNYGTFERTDLSGNDLGTFSASDYLLQFGYGHKVYKNFRGGVNLKLIGSYLEAYNSYALGTDLVLYYDYPVKNFSFGLKVQNLGLQVSSYTIGNRERLPFDVQCSITKKPKHVPFRYSFVFHHLHQWNIRYYDVSDRFYNVQVIAIDGSQQNEDKNYFVDNLFRHVTVNGELLLSNNFHILLGYNHLRRAELSLPALGGRSGFTFGLAIKVKRMEISYANAAYSLVGASNHISMTFNLRK